VAQTVSAKTDRNVSAKTKKISGSFHIGEKNKQQHWL